MMHKESSGSIGLKSPPPESVASSTLILATAREMEPISNSLNTAQMPNDLTDELFSNKKRKMRNPKYVNTKMFKQTAPEGAKEMESLKYGLPIRFVVKTDAIIQNVFCLFSNGFATKRLGWKSYINPNKEEEVFRIIPQMNYLHSKVIGKLNKEIEKNAGELTDEQIESLRKAQDGLKEEMQANYTVYLEQKGKNVTYGNVIQIVHEKSNHFVGVSNKVESREQKDEAYSLVLKAMSSNKTHFVILPSHRYQESGEGNIASKDRFYIAHKYQKVFRKDFCLGFPPFLGSDAETMALGKRAFLYDQLREAVQFEYAARKEENFPDHLLRNQEKRVCYISHIEHPYYLSIKRISPNPQMSSSSIHNIMEEADKKDHTQNEKKHYRNARGMKESSEDQLKRDYILDKLLNTDDKEEYKLHFKRWSSKSPLSSAGLWMIEPSLDTKDEVTFKNIIYDIRLNPIKIEVVVRDILKQNEFTEDSMFMIKYKHNTYLRFKSKNFEDIPMSENKSKKIEAYFGLQPADDFICTFKFMSINESDELNAKFIGEYLKAIINYKNDEGVMDYNSKFEYKMFRGLISELLRFCNNDLEIRINPNEPLKESNEIVQKLMRESGIMKELVNILPLIMPKIRKASLFGRRKENLKEDERKKGALLILKVLYKCVEQNEENQMYCFKGILGALQNTIKSASVGSVAIQVISAIIDGCEPILLHLGNALQSIIVQFIDPFKNMHPYHRWNSFPTFDILRQFCTFSGKGISHTQIYIYNLIAQANTAILIPWKFKNISSATPNTTLDEDRIIIQVKEKTQLTELNESISSIGIGREVNHGVVVFELEFERKKYYLDMNQLDILACGDIDGMQDTLQLTLTDDQLEIIQDATINCLCYIKSQFYLLADLCHNNQKCLNKILQHCPPISLLECLELTNPSQAHINLEIKAGFARIFYSIFANTEKCFSIQKPKLQRILMEEEDLAQNTSRFFHGKTEILRDLKLSISAYLADTASSSTIAEFDSAEMEFDFELIRLISSFMKSDLIFFESESRGLETIIKTFDFCAFFLEKYLALKEIANLKLLSRRSKMSVEHVVKDTNEEEEDEDEGEEEEEEVQETEEFSLEKLENATIPYYEHFIKIPIMYSHTLDMKLGNEDWSSDMAFFRKSGLEEILKGGIMEVCMFFKEILDMQQDLYITDFSGKLSKYLSNDDSIQETLEKMRNDPTYLIPWKNQKEKNMIKKISLENIYSIYQQHKKNARNELLKGKIREMLIGQNTSDSLFYIFMRLFSLTNSLNIQHILLTIILQYNFTKTRFIRSINKMVFITQVRHKDRYSWLKEQIDYLLLFQSSINSAMTTEEHECSEETLGVLSEYEDRLKELCCFFFKPAKLEGCMTGEWNMVCNEEYLEKLEETEPFFQNVFRSLNAYIIILEFMKTHEGSKNWAVGKLLETVSEHISGIHLSPDSQKAESVISIYGLCNRIITLFTYQNPNNQKIMLKHLDKLAIIPPLSVSFIGDEELEQYYATLCNPDLEMINTIMEQNSKIGNMGKSQTEALRMLIIDLNDRVNSNNIGIIFQIYENIMTESNDSKLNESLFSQLWEHKSKFNEKKLKDFTFQFTKDFINKQIQMVKALLLLVKNPELKMAKTKIQDIFQTDDLSTYIENMNRETVRKLPEAGLLKQTLIQIYLELYLTGEDKMPKSSCQNIRQFFNEVEVTLLNINISDITLADIGYYKTLYTFALQFEVMMVKKLDNEKIAQSLDPRYVHSPTESRQSDKLNIGVTITDFIVQKMTELYRQTPLLKEIKDELETQFGDLTYDIIDIRTDSLSHGQGIYDAIMQFVFRALNKQNIIFDSIIKEFRKSTIIVDELKLERKWLIEKVLGFIELAGEGDERAKEAKLFIQQLIFYIQKSPKNNPDQGNIKYLLLVFHETFEIVKNTTKGEKETEKRIENLIQKFHDLKLTRMILTLICAKNSPLMDAIFPSLLKLANAILENSPRYIQDAFYNYFITNKNSENLFEKMETEIRKNIYKVKKFPNKFGPKIGLGGEWIDTQLEILLFLKALCEGHHVGNQMLMTHQKTNRTSHDLTSIIVDYVKTLQFIAINNRLGYLHITKAFIALNEFLQGPCTETQDTIYQANIYPCAGYLLQLPFIYAEDLDIQKAKEEAAANLEEDVYLSSNYQIGKLKNLIMLLLLAIMEQRASNDPLIMNMRQILKFDIFKGNIIMAYLLYIKESNDYQEDILFKHFEEEDEEVEDNYCLDLGFNSLFLLKCWDEGAAKGETVFSSKVHEILGRQIKKSSSIWDKIFVVQIVYFCIDLVIGFTSFTKKSILGKKKMYTRKQIKDLTVKEEENMTKAITFFQDNSGAIEIVRGGVSETVYFPILPIKEVLSSSERDSLLLQLPVNQAKAKLDVITDNSMDMIIRLRNEYMFRRGVFRFYPVLGAVAKHTELWKTLSFYTAFILNILIFFSYQNDNPSASPQDRTKDPVIGQTDPQQSDQIFTGLGILLCVLSCIVMLSVLFKFIPYTFKQCWYNYVIKPFRKKTGNIAKLAIERTIKLVIGICVFLLRVLTNPNLVFFMLYFIFAILGVTLHYFYFAFHLTGIIFQSNHLRNALLAIWRPKLPIFLVLIFFLIVLYISALISYTYFAKDYDGELCSTLYKCFWSSFDMMFKGGIGDNIASPYDDEGDNVDYGRIAYDNLTNFILMILILEILAGLIIDTFGSLRDEANARDQDLNNNCIICGNNREYIEKSSGKTFENHIGKSHNLWAYVLFIAFVNRKPQDEHTGAESYVHGKFAASDSTWFPYFKGGAAKEFNEQDEIERLGIICTDVESTVEAIGKGISEINIKENKKGGNSKSGRNALSIPIPVPI